MDNHKINSMFSVDHLPEYLRKVSKPFRDLAYHIIETLPDSAERTLSLRNLWDAKNYAVYSAVEANKYG